VIRCPTLQVSQFLFPGQRSDTFLTDHVCIVHVSRKAMIISLYTINSSAMQQLHF